MTEPTRCPSCGEKMPANAIHGPCPACLLRQGAAASYSARFPTTQWNQVIAAGGRDAPKARAAFAELCAACWYPIYALIRRHGHSPEEAHDLTQDYFTRLLEKPVIAPPTSPKAVSGHFWSSGDTTLEFRGHHTEFRGHHTEFRSSGDRVPDTTLSSGDTTLIWRT